MAQHCTIESCLSRPAGRPVGLLLRQRPAPAAAFPGASGATASRASRSQSADTRAVGRVAVRAQAAEAAASSAAAVPAAAAEVPATPQSPLIYSGVIFDMDGTLTVSNIDYVTMRQKIGIPAGDLFTVMESWDDGDRIKRSMDIILELEADACTSLEGMPGLLELLAFLRASGIRVGLVTRNTTESLNSFFAAIGEDWRDVFDIMLTRDNTPYVKPDKRSLLHFAKEWGMHPWELLMVGDSTEDIETANAAGTASCMIAGGGNETATTAAAPPPLGAVPTFSVESLSQLQQRLADCDTALGWGAYGDRSLSLSSSSYDSEDDAASSVFLPGLAGAPPEGLEFLDDLVRLGAVKAASCSFPRIDGSRFGTPSDAHPGDRVLHLACGNGALTKLLFSSGLQVIGVDEDVEAVRRRGLLAVQLQPLRLSAGALQPEFAEMGQFDAVVYCAASGSSSTSEGFSGGYLSSPAAVAAVEAAAEQQQAGGECSLVSSWWQAESLGEIKRVLKPGGKLCVQAQMADEEAVQQQLAEAGFKLLEWEHAGKGACRLVAST